MKNRSYYAKLNIYITLLCQVLTMVCGIIVPRILITSFGSELYGATSSITQFLAYITLLEGGICGVARAALYKPLANNDFDRVNKILTEIKKFFRQLGAVFFIYVIVLACSFKSISNLSSYDWISTFLLVVVISISTFAQYFIGISYSVLLQAAQRTYITNIINIIGTIINTILVIVLAKFGCSLIIVKFASGCIFAIRPIALWLYARKLFPINDVKSEDVILKDKWIALGQHIAFFLHSHTDIAVLTILANLKLVAVYSVYNMVISAIQNLMSSFSTGMESLFGDMYAKEENELLKQAFSTYETMLSIVSIILFSTTATMIVPFVRIYTLGVEDTNYIYPIFGLLLTIAACLFALRTPYHSLIIAAGHFRQTNVAAYGEAIINIILSVTLVYKFGLIGVAIGTVAATFFRFVFYVIYLSKYIIQRSVICFIKRLCVNAILFTGIVVGGSSALRSYTITHYLAWGFSSLGVFIAACLLVIGTNFLLYKNDCKMIIKRFIKKQCT